LETVPFSLSEVKVLNMNRIFPVLMLVCGFLLMVWTLRFSRQILNGEETSLRKYLLGSALHGLWVFLIAVGGILTIGLIYESHGWSTSEKMEIMILGFGAGILGMVGSLWQFFLGTRFRESLHRNLKRKK
jgi:hypothetical protein